MKKQDFNVEFVKKITLEEYAFGLQMILKDSNCVATTGVLIPERAEILRDDKNELEKFYKTSLKHGFVKCSAEGVLTFERNIDTILKSISKSRFCVMVQKGCWDKNEKLLSLYWLNGCYIAAFQELKKNRVTILLDHDVEKIYDAMEACLTEKKDKAGFNRNQLNETLEKVSLQKSKIVPNIRLQCTFFDNWRNKIQTQENLLVDGTSLEQYATDANDLWQDFGKASELKERIVAIWKRLENDYEDKETKKTDLSIVNENDTKKEQQTTSESKWNYDTFLETKGFPRSYLGYFVWIIKNIFLGLKDFIKKPIESILIAVVLPILGCALFSAFSVFWNLYATCYLNDTYFFERRSIWGSFTPYLLSGSLRTPSHLKGFQQDWGVITTEWVVLPLSICTLLLLGMIISRMKKKGWLAIPKDLIGSISLIKRCKKVCQKSLFYFIQKGIFYSCIVGFVLFNPFAVALLVPLLLLAFMQGDDSTLAIGIMTWRTAGSVKKVESGKAKPIKYEEVLLDIFGLAMGFLFYTIFNVIMWNFFDYDWTLRLILSIILMLATLIQFEIKPPFKSKKKKTEEKKEKKEVDKKKKELVKKVQALVVVGICFLIAVIAMSFVLKTGIALADDGGWTESGGTIEGLIANLGFGLLMGITALVAFATFGATLATAATAAAIAFSASTIFASTTDYGHRTAEQLIYGRYSDSDPTILGTILQAGIELVPVWGNAYGLVCGARDISYDIQNWEGTTEDYINLAIDTFGFVMNGIALKGDVAKLKEYDGDFSHFTEKWRTGKEYTKHQLDDAGNLKPNARYKTGEYEYYYTTDDMGRIKTYETDDLQLTVRDERLPHNAKTPDKLKGDDAGHLIGDRFGGSPELDNLVSQDLHINRSDYKIIENQWENALKAKPPKKVTVRGELLYEGASKRPTGIRVEWTIDGKLDFRILPNMK